MQIHEFYSHERVDDPGFECVEGRWSWELNLQETNSDAYQAQLQWIDLFGKLDKRTFTFNVPGYVDYSIPLDLRVFLFQCRNNGNYPSWWILELNWTSGEFQLGTEPFLDEFAPRKPLIDRAGVHPNHIFRIILYRLEEIGGTKIGCSHCIVDIQQLHIQQIGTSFQLPSEFFNCLDLNDNIISGLSTSLDTITQFDLKSRQILTATQLYGLPPTICLFLQEINSTEFTYNRTLTAGLWTSENLYVWSEEKKPNGQILSTIYVVRLDDGVARALPCQFDGRIRRMVWSPDDQLCIRVDKLIKTEEIEGPLGSKIMNKLRITKRFDFYRLSVRRPEFLTFLSAAVLLRPCTSDVNQILDKRYDIPIFLRKI